jgi:hypothetical protein
LEEGVGEAAAAADAAAAEEAPLELAIGCTWRRCDGEGGLGDEKTGSGNDTRSSPSSPYCPALRFREDDCADGDAVPCSIDAAARDGDCDGVGTKGLKVSTTIGPPRNGEENDIEGCRDMLDSVASRACERAPSLSVIGRSLLREMTHWRNSSLALYHPLGHPPSRAPFSIMNGTAALPSAMASSGMGTLVPGMPPPGFAAANRAAPQCDTNSAANALLFSTLMQGVQQQQHQQSVLFSQFQNTSYLESQVAQLNDQLSRQRQKHDLLTHNLSVDLQANRQLVQSVTKELRDAHAQVKQLKKAAQSKPPSSPPSPPPPPPAPRPVLAVVATETFDIEGGDGADLATDTLEARSHIPPTIAPLQDDRQTAEIVSLKGQLDNLRSQHDCMVESAFELRQRCNDLEYSSAVLKGRAASPDTHDMAVQTMTDDELEGAPTVKELQRELAQKRSALEKSDQQRRAADQAKRDLEEQIALLEAALDAQNQHATPATAGCSVTPPSTPSGNKKKGGKSKRNGCTVPTATAATAVEAVASIPVTPEAVQEVVLSDTPKWSDAVKLIVGIMGDHIRFVETVKHYKDVSDAVCAALAKNTPRPYANSNKDRTTLGVDSLEGIRVRPRNSPASPASSTDAELKGMISQNALLAVCLQQFKTGATLTDEAHRKQKSLFVGAMRFHYAVMLQSDASLDITTRVALEQNMRQLTALVDRSDIPPALCEVQLKQPTKQQVQMQRSKK